jgi:hypothetical protein
LSSSRERGWITDLTRAARPLNNPLNCYLYPFVLIDLRLHTRHYILPCLLLASWLGPSPSFGQDDSKTTFPLENFYVKRQKPVLRGLLKNFRIGLSTGYGNTYFSHSLKGFAIYQAPNRAPDIFDAKGSPASKYSNWVNQLAADTSKLKAGAYTVSSDTTKLGFKGRSFNIPLKLTVHYEFLSRYRIGAGYSYEFMSLGPFRPTAFTDKIRSFTPSDGSGFMKKYFGVLGVSFARIDNYLFTADVNIGGFKPGSNFNSGLIKKGLYYNLGITAERELSEYLKVFVRPSYDFKRYTLNVPENKTSIAHSINAFYLNVGITYTVPELPKCFIPDCKVQINHAHGNKEYRSRVHPLYKKQNPGYGENNPLIKYKGKNKKKMNPY